MGARHVLGRSKLVRSNPTGSKPQSVKKMTVHLKSKKPPSSRRFRRADHSHVQCVFTMYTQPTGAITTVYHDRESRSKLADAGTVTGYRFVKLTRGEFYKKAQKK